MNSSTVAPEKALHQAHRPSFQKKTLLESSANSSSSSNKKGTGRQNRTSNLLKRLEQQSKEREKRGSSSTSNSILSLRSSTHFKKNATCGDKILEFLERLMKIIHPDNTLLRYYSLIVGASVLWTAIVVPMDLSFTVGWENGVIEDSNGSLHAVTIIDLVVDMIFVVDVFLSFRTGYFNEDGELVMESARIVRTYMMSWFFPDLCASIPVTFIELSGRDAIDYSGDDRNTALQGLKMLKILRLFRLGRLAHVLLQYGFAGHIRVFRMVLMFLLFIHWFGCAWFWIESYQNFTGWSDGGLIDMANSTRWEKYVLSFYWSTTTLTTVGYGDMSPVTTDEMILTVVIMIFGSVIFATIFGTITNVLSEMDANNKRYMRKIETLQLFLKSQHIPMNLQKRIYQYYNFLWDRHRTFDEDSIMHELPVSLYFEVAEHIHNRMFQHSVIWKECPRTQLQLIMGKLHDAKSVVYLPLDCIFFESDPIEFLYFVEKGTVTLFRENVATSMRNDGSYLGDVGMMRPPKLSPEDDIGDVNFGDHFVTAKATTYCDVHMIEVQEIMSLVETANENSADDSSDAITFSDLIYAASERRREMVVKAMNRFEEAKGKDEDYHPYTAEEDGELLVRTISKHNREIQIKKMCAESMDVAKTISANGGGDLAQQKKIARHQKFARLKDVSKTVIASLRNVLDEEKSMPFAKTTKVTESRLRNNDVVDESKNVNMMMTTTDYSQTLAARSRRTRRNRRGGGAWKENPSPADHALGSRANPVSSHAIGELTDKLNAMRNSQKTMREKLQGEIRSTKATLMSEMKELKKLVMKLGRREKEDGGSIASMPGQVM